MRCLSTQSEAAATAKRHQPRASKGRAAVAYAAPLGGIPPEQLALVDRRPRVFSERIREILATRMWSRDNYFYHGYCTGQFDPGPKCPRYMSAEHYPKLLSLGVREAGEDGDG